MREVREQKPSEDLRAGELRVLEQIATGAPLSEILEALVHLVEGISDGMRGSLLLLEDGVRVRHAAAPSLPRSYTDAIDGLAIGPDYGSCGTAAYRRVPVITEDIAADPLWEGYREVAAAHGLRACWSFPILAADGSALGTFALYAREPRRPAAEDFELFTRATHLAAIAIQRQRSEDALRQSEAEFRVTFERAGIGMALVDARGHAVRCNAPLERFLGYSAAELSQRSVPELTHPDDIERDTALYGQLLAGEIDSYQIEKRYFRKDGEIVWGRLTISLVPSAAGPPLFAIAMVEDITERTRLQSEIQGAQKMEAVGLLAGGIAHDFNNILAVILGYGQIALRHLAAADSVRPRVEGILAAADRAALLTQQLLAFSRKQTFDIKVLSLNGVIEDLSRILTRLLGEDIDLVLTLGEGVGNVRADRSQVDQILMNLAVNARDAMPAGGRLFVETATVEVGGEFVRAHPGCAAGRYVRLTVTDTGSGMTSATMGRIFDPFFTTKGPGKGTGLGLSTVYGIVRQSGGAIEVESQPGSGTTFRISLPRVEEPASAAARGAVSVPKGTETVLVAEDEVTLREVIREQLEWYGYRVLAAENAAGALQIAQTEPGPIDVLLTDVVMPDMNGRELARRVGAVRPRVKVLYMSGYSDDIIARHGGLEADRSLLSKPFASEDLVRRVRELLEPKPER